MDVLIIGGTGLISTAITRELLEEGHRVTLFNRGRTGTKPPGVETIHGSAPTTRRSSRGSRPPTASTA